VPEDGKTLAIRDTQPEVDRGESSPELTEGLQQVVELAQHPAQKINNALEALADQQRENLARDFQTAMESLGERFPFDIALAVASPRGETEKVKTEKMSGTDSERYSPKNGS
jgi:hypothetical protein